MNVCEFFYDFWGGSNPGYDGFMSIDFGSPGKVWFLFFVGVVLVVGYSLLVNKREDSG